MPQSMLSDAAHGSDAARWQITVAVCCRRVSVRRDHVHAATQHRLLRDPGVLIGHVVQVCWSRDPGVLYVVPGLLSRLSSSRRDVSRPRLKSLENRNPASRAQVCWSRDTGVRAEHSDGDYVVAVVLDQHRERPGGALIAPWASCSHTHTCLCRRAPRASRRASTSASSPSSPSPTSPPASTPHCRGYYKPLSTGRF